jgi:hypothetical protein
MIIKPVNTKQRKTRHARPIVPLSDQTFFFPFELDSPSVSTRLPNFTVHRDPGACLSLQVVTGHRSTPRRLSPQFQHTNNPISTPVNSPTRVSIFQQKQHAVSTGSDRKGSHAFLHAPIISRTWFPCTFGFAGCISQPRNRSERASD